MERMTAAGNLSIEFDAERWRLLANGTREARLLLEAEAGQPLRYVSAFAERRRLPPNGQVERHALQRVVLGWSPEDECWHLGLLLEPIIANPRGSRWCEVARWPDPDTNVFQNLATEAGKALARTLAIPFNYIAPQPIPAPASPPPPPLRPLPLQFDQWLLSRGDTALSLERLPGWGRSQITRAFWYGLLAVVYALLSIASLQGSIAPPRPEFLPVLGLLVALLLVVLALVTLIQFRNRPEQIVVSPGGVAARRSARTLWQIDRGRIDAIYVSEVVGRKARKRRIEHAELNLLLNDGSFRGALVMANPTEDEYTEALPESGEPVTPLSLFNAHTDLEMAGLHLAQELGVECRLDRRKR